MPVFTPGSSRCPSVDSGIGTPENSSIDEPTISTVLRLFEKSVAAGDPIENACKDIASLIHSLNLIDATLKWIRRCNVGIRAAKLYGSLLVQLRVLSEKQAPPISSRTVYVEVPSHYPPISLELLKALFPNIQKVWRIIMSRSARRCLVEFASHSSARRAVDSRLGSIGSACSAVSHNTVKCTWASPQSEIPSLRIEYVSELPVIEMCDDESIIAPSSDWRRPRPRPDSQFAAKQAELFSVPDLLSILRGTGAFDDYPPHASQIRF
jgi:hypothetical protein